MVQEMKRGQSWAKATYTIEASVIVPLFLFMMVTSITIGIELYHEAESKSEQERTAKIWVVDEFYALQAIGEVVDIWKDE